MVILMLNTAGDGQRKLARDTIESDRSILAQRRDPDMYRNWHGWRRATIASASIGNGHSVGVLFFASRRSRHAVNDLLEEDFFQSWFVPQSTQDAFSRRKEGDSRGLEGSL